MLWALLDETTVETGFKTESETIGLNIGQIRRFEITRFNETDEFWQLDENLDKISHPFTWNRIWI